MLPMICRHKDVNYVKERLTFFTGHLGNYLVAVICLVAVTCALIARVVPPLEIVPFTATGAQTALTLFALALIVHDGLLVLIAFVLTIATMATVLSGLSLTKGIQCTHDFVTTEEP